jgi:hypothetical protein
MRSELGRQLASQDVDRAEGDLGAADVVIADGLVTGESRGLVGFEVGGAAPDVREPSA